MWNVAITAQPDTATWDTSSATNLGYMFFGAENANPDVSNWDTASVTDLISMFYELVMPIRCQAGHF